MNRRQVLNGVQSSHVDHAGLWLDKYLGNDRDAEKAKTTLIHEVSQIREPATYKYFFHQWQAALAQRQHVQTRIALVDTRMVVGLGAESVVETSVCLHRTYGVPYIPGSALKGITAGYARNHLEGWQAPNPDSHELNQYAVVFGTTASAGFITFYDALYIPNSAHQPVVVDVMTPHHSKYLDGKHAPTDFDAPVPVPFVSATGSYLLALGGDARWVDVVFTIMALALAEAGVGAKTASGYGRLTIESPPPDPDQEVVDDLLADIQRLRLGDVATRLDPLFRRWQQLAAKVSLKQQVATALLQKVHDAGRTRQSEDKAWYKELQQSLQI